MPEAPVDYPGIDGFLPTRASIMLDVVFVAMALVIPLMLYAIYLVKYRRAYELHRKIPKELNVTCPDQTHIVIEGCDKQKVGQFAAEVRSLRKPEPYKGKGVRYQGEQVKIKPGKSATK